MNRIPIHLQLKTSALVKKMFSLRRLVFLQIGAVLIAIALITFMSRPFSFILIGSLVFTNVIAHCVMLLYVAVDRLGFIQSVRQPKHWPIWLAIVFMSVSIGTLISLMILSLLYKFNIYDIKSSFFPMLKFNLIIAAVWSLLEISFEYLRDTINKKAAENEELKLLQEKTRLQVLQSKLNPHFLFNSLNSMLNLVYKEPAKVEQIIISLSGLYRHMLQSFDRETNTLADEIALIGKYLEIEKIRMGKRLQYTLDLPDAFADVAIPALLLEPLVENAVIHGIAPKPEGGQISLTVTAAPPDRVHIIVCDNGMGLRHSAPINGFGLVSVKERLRLFYRGSATFTIASPSSGGTQIDLEFPHDIPHTDH